MKILQTLGLALILVTAACNTAYQTPVAEVSVAEVSQAERDAQTLEMKKARSFAHEYYKQHNYTEARDYFLKMFALDVEGKYNTDLTRLATCYTQIGNQDSAQVVLELAVDKMPDSHYSHRTLGMLYKNTGKADAAYREFQTCVEIKPEDWESHLEIKNTLHELAMEDGSLDAWDRVIDRLETLIELRSEDTRFAREKDQILGKFYDPEDIIQSLRTNHASFPDDLKLTRKLARSLVEFATSETYTESLPLLDELIAAGGDFSAYDLKATALEGLGRGQDAASVLKTMVEMSPEKRELPARLATLYLDMEKLSAARVWAQRTKSRFPNFGKGYMLMARVYEAAVDQCSKGDLSFDDKLVYEKAANEYARVKDPAYRSAAKQRQLALEEVLPTAEDRFFNKNEEPKGECYQWLLK
jgi:tetratricopeptide (TPR) repeat protein